MSSIFPFQVPTPTAFYLVLYIVSWAVHMALVQYVLAGTTYLTFFGFCRRDNGPEIVPAPIAAPLRDWLPAALSAAITAGVAPLLFLQVLFKREFYTANLLLGHRWMVILPALIVGFYLLYVCKVSNPVRNRHRVRMCAGGALVCFVFTGMTWSRNHLLSLEESSWTSVFASGIAPQTGLWWRALTWFGLSFPTMATILAWQIHAVARRKRERTVERSPRNGQELSSPVRSIGLMAVIGLMLAVTAGAIYFGGLNDQTRAALTGPMSRPYLGVLGAAIMIQTVSWTTALLRRNLSSGLLTFATIGLVCSLLTVSVVREVIRVSQIDIHASQSSHVHAAQVRGFLVFVVCSLVVSAAVAWCVRVGHKAAVGLTPQKL